MNNLTLYHRWVGKRFKKGEDIYILAQTDYEVFKLIDLKDGNRWSDNTMVLAKGLNKYLKHLGFIEVKK